MHATLPDCLHATLPVCCAMEAKTAQGRATHPVGVEVQHEGLLQAGRQRLGPLRQARHPGILKGTSMRSTRPGCAAVSILLQACGRAWLLRADGHLTMHAQPLNKGKEVSLSGLSNC